MEATKTETELDVLRRENEELKKEIAVLKEDDEIEIDTHVCEDNPDHVAMLEMFADPNNWKDDRIWSPVMGHVERDPVLLARSVL